MQQLTQIQYNTLKEGIYYLLMGSLDMGDMGAATDEAERVVNEWMELNKITLKEN